MENLIKNGSISSQTTNHSSNNNINPDIAQQGSLPNGVKFGKKKRERRGNNKNLRVYVRCYSTDRSIDVNNVRVMEGSGIFMKEFRV